MTSQVLPVWGRFLYSTRKGGSILCHLSVCYQSNVNRFQCIILKFCVILHTNNNSSWFHFGENRVKVKAPNFKLSKSFLLPTIFMARLQTFKQYARPWRTRVPWLAKHLTSIGWCQHDVIKKHQSCSIALAFQGELHFSGHCSLSSQISSENLVIQIYTYYSHMKVEILLKLIKMYRKLDI